MHESLYELALYSSRSFVPFPFRFAHFLRQRVREHDARKFDFVISLIAAGSVTLKSSTVLLGGINASVVKIRTSPKYDPTSATSNARRRSLPETASRLTILRNEETRFTPGNLVTLHAARTLFLLCTPAFRITMLSIDSIRLAIRLRTLLHMRPYFTQPSSRSPDYR